MVLFTTNTLKVLTEHEEITYFEIRQSKTENRPLSYIRIVSQRKLLEATFCQRDDEVAKMLEDS